MTQGFVSNLKEWSGWVAVNILGLAPGPLIVVAFVTSSFGDWVLGPALVIAGGILASGQWVWLRRRVKKAGWWIAAAVAGWILVTGVVALLDLFHVDTFLEQRAGRVAPLIHVTFSLALIFVLSLPQWLLLRRECRKASMWIIARPLGWGAGLGSVSLAESLHVVTFGGFWFPAPEWLFGLSVPELLGWAAVGAIFGLGLGAVTGAAMIWMRQIGPDRGAIGGQREAHSFS
jgi:hypothetical protein